MPFIVSANYRDRSSEYRWLVRRIDQKPEEAVACKRVTARGIRFKDSNEAEKGFGCRIVAFCESVETHEHEPRVSELKFDGWSFVNEGKEKVHTCDVLELFDDGRMLATV